MKKTIILLITLVNSFAFSQDNLSLKKSLQSLNAKNQSKFDLLILKADKKTTKELKEKKPALAGFAGEIPIFWESDDAPANRSANLAPLKTGTLTFANMENRANYNTSSIGVNYATGTDVAKKDKGLTPNIGVTANGDANSTTHSAIEAGATITITGNQTQDLNKLSRCDPYAPSDGELG